VQAAIPTASVVVRSSVTQGDATETGRPPTEATRWKPTFAVRVFRLQCALVLLPLFTTFACGGSVDALPQEGGVTADAGSAPAR
jgi:hypothetical protein